MMRPPEYMSCSPFLDADVLVIIDDWKASSDKESRAPAYFCGRSFAASDPLVWDLCRQLNSASAASWHASGARSDFGFLFNSSSFDPILEFLNAGATCLYGMLASVDSFDVPEIHANWRSILHGNPELRAAWGVGSPYAKALFRFADFLCWDLVDTLPPGTRVKLVVDSLDWLTARSDSLQCVADGVVSLGSAEREIEVELVCLANKRLPGAATYLPLLGLVDSEAWAFGRLNTLRLQDGPTIRERYLDWQTRGSPQDECVVSEEEYNQAMAPHANHLALRAYWDAIRRWSKSRHVALPRREMSR